MPTPAAAFDARADSRAATLRGMDPVRFGRALGVGARAAAKTVVHAADAATSPNPAGARPAARSAPTVVPPARADTPRVQQVRSTVSASATRARQTAGGVREGSRRFGQEVWQPFRRLSGVLWLEFTGVFFGIFAAFALTAVVRLHGAWRRTPANASEHARLVGASLMLAVFGYFCVSSFLQAKRREKRR